MNDFDLEDLERTLTQPLRDAICDVILAWATYDVMVSNWIVLAFGLPLEAGSILIGNMDTKGKLDRLKLLYAQHHTPQHVAFVSQFQKRHAKFVLTRNTIAHASCRGVLKSDPERAVFSFLKSVSKDRLLISAIHISEMRVAAAYASEASAKILKFTDAIQPESLASIGVK